jgi:hypothetical protein
MLAADHAAKPREERLGLVRANAVIHEPDGVIDPLGGVPCSASHAEASSANTTEPAATRVRIINGAALALAHRPTTRRLPVLVCRGPTADHRA